MIYAGCYVQGPGIVYKMHWYRCRRMLCAEYMYCVLCCLVRLLHILGVFNACSTHGESVRKRSCVSEEYLRMRGHVCFLVISQPTLPCGLHIAGPWCSRMPCSGGDSLLLCSGEGRGWELSGPLGCSGRADRRYVAHPQATVALCLSEEVV